MSLRFALLLGTASAVVVACNAIVGVEDVTLRNGTPPVEDGGEGEPDAIDGIDQAAPPSERASLALGFNHTCARLADSTVKCWGDNGAGQLGNGVTFDGGTPPDVLKPTRVPDIDDAIAIGSGLSHTCVVHKTGTASCWGSNFFGQLGDGTKEKSSKPVRVSKLDDIVDVVGGTSFTCARHKDKSVSCWGANYSGQLGDGTKTDRTTAAPVKSLSGAVSIAAATDHACAALENGDVVCWGGNTEGQLGNGTTTESLTPTRVSTLTGVAQVAAAARFSCALLRSGKIYCWGNNQSGQLGNGIPNGEPNPSPILVSAVGDGVFLWTGFEHACAVRKSGKIMCWGSAGDGQTGKGTVPADASVASPVEVADAPPSVAVWTGGNRSCALAEDGKAYCWGINTTGQLGNGTRERAYKPVPVNNFP